MKEAAPKKTKRNKPVIGSLVAKQMIWFLREWKKKDSQESGGLRYDYSAEIEHWEDQIRSLIKQQRREPREMLELDSATLAALDEAYISGVNKHSSRIDQTLRNRRAFALRMIQAGCEAVMRENERMRLFTYDFAIEFRDMTQEEKQIELMIRQSGLEQTDPQTETD